MRARLAWVTVAAFLGISTAAQAQEVTSAANLLANPGGETGTLDGWSGSAFGVATYGAGSAPSTDFASAGALGQRLFEATDGGRLEQIVDVSVFGDTIDAGTQTFDVGGDFAAVGAVESQPTMVVQGLSTEGVEIGASRSTGPAAPELQDGRPAVAQCRRRVLMPVGTRRIRVTLVAAPAARSFFDVLAVEPVERPTPASGPTATASAPGADEMEPQCWRVTAVYPIPAQPPPPASPCPGQRAARVRITGVRLAARSVSIRTSRPARVMVTVSRTAGGRVATMRVRTVANRFASRRVSRLRGGSYRVVARVAGQTARYRRAITVAPAAARH